MPSALVQIFSGGVWTPWDGVVSATIGSIDSITNPVTVTGAVALEAGAANIGSVGIQAGQSVALAAGAANIGSVGIQAGQSLAVTTLAGASIANANSANVLASGLVTTPIFTMLPGMWTITSSPAAGTRAVNARAAGGVGVINVATHACFTLVTAEAQAPLKCRLLNGATGVGSVIWTGLLGGPANTCVSLIVSGIMLPASDNTALTVEFDVAPAATNMCSVTACGIRCAA
jgi:hypothetical protein